MTNTEIDIVITTCNSEKYIKDLLNSIKVQSFNDYFCFVIDDNSDDNTVKIIKNNFSWVKLIEQKKNYGPAKNRNVATKLGNSPFIVFFDGDVFLKDKDWLGKALEKIRSDNNIGQLASMIVSGYDDDILLDCGIHKSSLFFGGIFHKLNKNYVIGKHNLSRQILGACTAGTILRRDVFERIRGFDDKYFYMSEDLDLSARIHLVGYDVLYEPSLVTHHYESHAMGKRKKVKEYLYYRNSCLVLLENYPLKYALKKISVFFIKSILSSFFHFFTRNFLRVKRNFFFDTTKYFKIFFYILIYSPNIILKRFYINKYRKRERQYLINLNDGLKNKILLELPVKSLIYSITNTCNAKCKMCFQYKDLNKPSELLTLDELRRIVINMPHLNNIVLGGGEPFLREDIDQMCGILIKLRNPNITIPTNGSLPEVMYEKTKKILGLGANRLVISLSLDGDESFHDSNRGIPGLFNKVKECYEKLARLKLIYGERLYIQINSCISKDNFNQFDFLYNYITANMPMADWVFEPIRGFFNKDLVCPILLDDWNILYNKIGELNKKSKCAYNSVYNLSDIYKYSISILEEKRQIVPCAGGKEFIYMDHVGNIFPCELLPSAINIRDVDYNPNLLLGNKSWLESLDKIKQKKCYCTHFCWLSYSIDKYKYFNQRFFNIKKEIKKFLNNLLI